jgi:hypothetical protein
VEEGSAVAVEEGSAVGVEEGSAVGSTVSKFEGVIVEGTDDDGATVDGTDDDGLTVNVGMTKTGLSPGGVTRNIGGGVQ